MPNIAPLEADEVDLAVRLSSEDERLRAVVGARSRTVLVQPTTIDRKEPDDARQAVVGFYNYDTNRSLVAVVDLGTDTDAERIDYPEKARAIGEAILRGDAERGVFVCGSGVGASIAASKLPGIRAAICHDVYSAHQGVEHDDMNVLCLGSEVVGPSLARDLVTTFLAARFDGGERYVKRLQMIEDLERNASHA